MCTEIYLCALMYFPIHSHKLPLSVSVCIYIHTHSLTYTQIHIHSHKLKYTKIHANTLKYTHYIHIECIWVNVYVLSVFSVTSVFECLWVLWVYLIVFDSMWILWVYLSVFELQVLEKPCHQQKEELEQKSHSWAHAHRESMDFQTFDDHVKTDPDNTDLEYITNIHSNTLTYTHIHSNTLYVNDMCVFECIWVYVSVSVCMYLQSHTIKYTHIHS
jgi:hypothetical protein